MLKVKQIFIHKLKIAVKEADETKYWLLYYVRIQRIIQKPSTYRHYFLKLKKTINTYNYNIKNYKINKSSPN